MAKENSLLLILVLFATYDECLSRITWKVSDNVSFEWLSHRIKHGKYDHKTVLSEFVPEEQLISPSAHTACFTECNIKAVDRVSCGYLGSSKRKCMIKKCCWDDKENDPSKRCYKKDVGICEDPACSNIRPTNRVTCSALQDKPKHRSLMDYCIRAGCCWDEDSAGTSCFDKDSRGSPLQCDGVAVEDKIDCGWRSITEYECTSRGCCYDESHNAGPWCYYKTRATKSVNETTKDTLRMPSTPEPTLVDITTQITSTHRPTSSHQENVNGSSTEPPPLETTSSAQGTTSQLQSSPANEDTFTDIVHETTSRRQLDFTTTSTALDVSTTTTDEISEHSGEYTTEEATPSPGTPFSTTTSDRQTTINTSEADISPDGLPFSTRATTYHQTTKGTSTDRTSVNEATTAKDVNTRRAIPLIDPHPTTGIDLLKLPLLQPDVADRTNNSKNTSRVSSNDRNSWQSSLICLFGDAKLCTLSLLNKEFTSTGIQREQEDEDADEVQGFMPRESTSVIDPLQTEQTGQENEEPTDPFVSASSDRGDRMIKIGQATESELRDKLKLRQKHNTTLGNHTLPARTPTRISSENFKRMCSFVTELNMDFKPLTSYCKLLKATQSLSQSQIPSTSEMVNIMFSLKTQNLNGQSSTGDGVSRNLLQLFNGNNAIGPSCGSAVKLAQSPKKFQISCTNMMREVRDEGQCFALGCCWIGGTSQSSTMRLGSGISPIRSYLLRLIAGHVFGDEVDTVQCVKPVTTDMMNKLLAMSMMQETKELNNVFPPTTQRNGESNTGEPSSSLTLQSNGDREHSYTQGSERCENVEMRIGCGDSSTTAEECESWNCCWDPKSDQPTCFLPADA